MKPWSQADSGAPIPGLRFEPQIYSARAGDPGFRAVPPNELVLAFSSSGRAGLLRYDSTTDRFMTLDGRHGVLRATAAPRWYLRITEVNPAEFPA